MKHIILMIGKNKLYQLLIKPLFSSLNYPLDDITREFVAGKLK